VDYNNENAYYRINCHSHDVTDVFSMFVDCALEPRNVVACAVGRLKNEEAHKLDAESGGNYRFNDQIFAAAYGGKTLGNPVYGRRSNIANLSAEVIQKFQMANMTNDRIVISATGIENHQ
jgi:predicted Zn-dependent peptidase